MRSKYNDAVALHAHASVAPTLVGSDPDIAAQYVITAAATTVMHEDKKLLRVGVLVTVNKSVAEQDDMDEVTAVAIIRSAMEELSSALSAQFGAEAWRFAMEDTDVEPDENRETTIIR